MEIERKFLISSDFNVDRYIYTDIEQSYISFEPEVRIRRRDDVHTLTFKSNGNLERCEIEILISEQIYRELSEMVQTRAIRKKRYIVRIGSHIGELDVYDEIWNLTTIEVEFDSREEAEVFEVPEWFGEELTYKGQYKNKNLAKNGLKRGGSSSDG